LHEAITAQRLVVSATSADQPQRGLELSVLAELLLERYRSSGQSDDLNEAISFARAALASPRADRSGSAAVLANLGVAMRHLFTRTGNLDDLNEAIQLGRAALGAVADDDPRLAAIIAPLGVALRIRFGRSGEAADLDEAIRLGRQAVALADQDPVNTPAALTGLGLALQTRFVQSGNLRDIDEAIDLARQALATAGDAHPERPTFLTNLSASLALRFRAEGRPADVADAIEFGQQAIEITPPDHPSRHAIVANFNYVQRLRIEASPSAVDEARPELVDAVRLSHIAIGAGFPGPLGALAADVLAGDLDIWQAETRAASMLGPTLSNATELEDWSLIALERATNGIWAESVVFLRLLMTAIEGATDGGPLGRARASVGANFVGVAALALTSHADPELFTRALVVGQWAEDWAARHGRTDLRLRALNSLTLLHLLPYTQASGRSPTTSIMCGGCGTRVHRRI
jgi:tetratricopeptide (TPR) repeat protein